MHKYKGSEKAYNDFSRQSLQYDDKRYFYNIKAILRKYSLEDGIPWNEFLMILKAFLKVEEMKTLPNSKLDEEDKELKLFVENLNNLKEAERRYSQIR